MRYQSREQLILQKARQNKIALKEVEDYLKAAIKQIARDSAHLPTETNLEAAERLVWRHFFRKDEFPKEQSLERPRAKLADHENANLRNRSLPQPAMSVAAAEALLLEKWLALGDPHTLISFERSLQKERDLLANSYPVHKYSNPEWRGWKILHRFWSNYLSFENLPRSTLDSRSSSSKVPLRQDSLPTRLPASHQPLKTIPNHSVSETLSLKALEYVSQRNIIWSKADEMRIPARDIVRCYEVAFRIAEELFCEESKEYRKWHAEWLVWLHHFKGSSFPGKKPSYIRNTSLTLGSANTTRHTSRQGGTTVGIRLKVPASSVDSYRHGPENIRPLESRSLAREVLSNRESVTEQTTASLSRYSDTDPVKSPSLTSTCHSTLAEKSLPWPVLGYVPLEKVMETKASAMRIRRDFFQYLQKSRDLARNEHSACDPLVRHYIADKRTWTRFFKDRFPSNVMFGPEHHSNKCKLREQTGQGIGQRAPIFGIIQETPRAADCANISLRPKTRSENVADGRRSTHQIAVGGNAYRLDRKDFEFICTKFFTVILGGRNPEILQSRIHLQYLDNQGTSALITTWPDRTVQRDWKDVKVKADYFVHSSVLALIRTSNKSSPVNSKRLQDTGVGAEVPFSPSRTRGSEIWNHKQGRLLLSGIYQEDILCAISSLNSLQDLLGQFLNNDADKRAIEDNLSCEFICNSVKRGREDRVFEIRIKHLEGTAHNTRMNATEFLFDWAKQALGVEGSRQSLSTFFETWRRLFQWKFRLEAVLAPEGILAQGAENKALTCCNYASNSARQPQKGCLSHSGNMLECFREGWGMVQPSDDRRSDTECGTEPNAQPLSLASTMKESEEEWQKYNATFRASDIDRLLIEEQAKTEGSLRMVLDENTGQIVTLDAFSLRIRQRLYAMVRGPRGPEEAARNEEIANSSNPEKAKEETKMQNEVSLEGGKRKIEDEDEDQDGISNRAEKRAQLQNP